MIITNANIVLENRIVKGSLKISGKHIDTIVENENIRPLNNEQVFDVNGKYVMPGVVDLHSHGSGGFDVMDGEESDIINAGKSYAKHGTTTVLPTSLTSSDYDLFLFLENINKVMRKQKSEELVNSAKIAGAHLEGPYFDMVQKGAQDSRYIQNPKPEHYNQILEKSEGSIKRWSLAPELEGSFELIDTLVRNNILVSGGHTDANYDVISKAYDHGMNLLTHFYSGMSSLTRKGGFRVLGTIESGYLIDDLYVELISDGMHLPPELLKMIFKLKRHDRIISCSDSMRGAGLSDGWSILGPKNNGTDCIIEDGIAKMPDRTCFAASVATGDRLVRTLHCIAGLPLDEVSRITSLQPAKLINMDSSIGSIKEGKAADILVCDEEINLYNVFVNGKEVSLNS